MKKFIFTLLIAVTGLTAGAQTKAKQPAKPQVITDKIVEIACGECQFKMKGPSCDLAVRIDGKPYFVNGKKIDDFGDAHADEGFCNAISKAKVSGVIENKQFKATSVKLLPQKNKQ